LVLRVKPRFLKALDPYGQAKWWSIYRSVIPPDRFRVRFEACDGYIDLLERELTRVRRAVAEVRERFEFVEPKDTPRDRLVRLKVPSDPSPLWLLTEADPADRYLILRPETPHDPDGN
jgi:hypothetical protein